MIGVHPERHQIRLENVLSALGNPLRLEIVRVLAAEGQQACGSILDGIPKTTLTRHWKVLRDSGIIWQRPYGRENLLSLRTDDLEARFPGLLPTLLDAAERNANSTYSESDPANTASSGGNIARES
ncbi:ArsR/SmtB family transcription factor [Nocardia sp. NPDC020380]|uniref:ArsR/SmtB family transcription factor n=1 Tax=Nocardia sp. NPDC020380 TaxID=3364309 RepID=UPI0037BB1075